MVKGEVGQLAGRRAARLAAMLAIGLSLTAAHPGAHDAPRTPGSGAPSATIDVATPVGTVMAFHAALASGDTDAALMHLSEDVVIFESGGVENSRAEYAIKPMMVKRWFADAGLIVSKDRVKVDGHQSSLIAATFPVDGKGWPELRPYSIDLADIATM